MKNNYTGKKNHAILGWAIEIGLCAVMVGVCLGFAIMMFADNSGYEDYRKIAAEINEIENQRGTPDEWHIISINEDYSEALVLKTDGQVYDMTIYEATDNMVSIIVDNGEIHDYYYQAP